MGAYHIPGLAFGFSGVMLFFGICIFLFFGWCIVRILHKAGYSGCLVIIFFIPILNLIFILIFAFAKWPNVLSSPPHSQ